MSLKLLFKVTSRSRPERCIKTLDSIVNNIANKDDYSIQCTFDSDDNTTNNQAFIDKLHTYKRLTYYFGNSLNKIDAINKNIEKFPSKWDILFNVSDDQLFLVQGFDNIVRSDMSELGGLDWFLHYPDSHAKDRLPTMSIMGYDYFKRTNLIYPECYESVYADNHVMDVAKILGKHRFINKTIYDHFHPAWGMVPKDEQYLRTEHPAVYAKDRATYDEQKINNFWL